MRPMRPMLLILLLLELVVPTPRARAAEQRCFTQTGLCIEGRFLQYWEQNGGLPVFGYPVTPARQELNRDTGQNYLTQWFERTRFELHPETAAPYDVLLGRLGDDRLLQQRRDWQRVSRETGPAEGCLWFETTGHTVCDQEPGVGFKTFWQTHGLADPRMDDYGRSLALFGLPLTVPIVEQNANGDWVLAQWFERARFEWHPDKPAEYRVLLGLLGGEVLTDISGTGFPSQITADGGRAFFSAGDGSHGMELWVSSGASAQMVRDICLGACSSTPMWLTPLGGRLFFIANDGGHGYELWVSDGTGAGTTMVKDICPGSCDSYPSSLTTYKGSLVFAAFSPATGQEIWRSDGTAAGTQLVSDIVPGPDGSYPAEFEQVGDTLYVSAYRGGASLWRTDGTAAGTQLVALVGGGTSLSWLTQAGGRLFFVSFAEPYGSELWVSDGSAAGTRLVKDINPGSAGAAPQGLTVLDSQVIFWADDAAHFGQLWRSDGTAAGTTRIMESSAHGGSLVSDILPVTVNGLVYFSASVPDGDPSGNTQLWRTDGTDAGTFSLGIANPHDLAASEDAILVAETTGGLWRSAGAAGSSVLVRQLTPATSTGGPVDMTSAGGQVFLTIDPGWAERQLWRSDGTGDGTRLIAVIGRTPWLAR